MVDIPESLCSLYTATVEEDDDRYIIEVPRTEVEHEAVEADGTYRVALLGEPSTTSSGATAAVESTQTGPDPRAQGPPVEEGEQREVTIESLGDKGDGIAKVERGYVLIVPGAEPGDKVTVEIEQVRENVAFTKPVDAEA